MQCSGKASERASAASGKEKEKKRKGTREKQRGKGRREGRREAGWQSEPLAHGIVVSLSVDERKEKEIFGWGVQLS